MTFTFLAPLICVAGTGTIVGAWQRVPIADEQVPFEIIYFASNGAFAMRGEHAFDGHYEREGSALSLSIRVNEAILQSSLFVEIDEGGLSTRAPDGTISDYREIERPFPDPLGPGSWRQREIGKIRISTPENWVCDGDPPDANGRQRVFVQSPDGLTILIVLRLPYAYFDPPQDFDFTCKDLFREFLQSIEPGQVLIDEDAENSLFGRPGLVFHSRLEIENQPVYAHAWGPKQPLAYNLIVMSISAHNESAALRRVIHGTSLIP